LIFYTKLSALVNSSCSRRIYPHITTMSDKEIKEGDQVSWQWSGSRPGGTVAEVAKEGELSIETKNGNTVKKNADSDDPAVKISRSGNDVVKRAHELDVEEAGDKHKEDKGEEKTVSKDDKEEKDETKDEDDKKEDKEDEKKESGKGGQKKKPAAKAKTGDKRQAKDDGEEEKASKKQQKTEDAGEENGDKKKRGRPAKNGNEASSSSSKPKKEPKKAATQSGEPRRSTRLKSS